MVAPTPVGSFRRPPPSPSKSKTNVSHLYLTSSSLRRVLVGPVSVLFVLFNDFFCDVFVVLCVLFCVLFVVRCVVRCVVRVSDW